MHGLEEVVMTARLPNIALQRTVGSHAQWQAIQGRLWECDACRGHARVEINVRQQTPAPTMTTNLLFVGVAPPDQGNRAVRTAAKSATNDTGDNLRTFIEAAAALRWDDLIGNGAFLVHAVKCAIVPDRDGFQNPPTEVVDRCCSVWFAEELQLLRPASIVALGGAARRAVLRHPSVTAPRGVGVSKSLEKLQESWPHGIPCKLGSDAFTLHPAPFPRSAMAKQKATIIIREATRLAGLDNDAG
jgi:uracil-DNA glycosylase